MLSPLTILAACSTLTAAEDSDFTQLAANLVNGQADRIGYIADDSPIPIGADYGYTQNYEDYMLAGSPFLTNGSIYKEPSLIVSRCVSTT